MGPHGQHGATPTRKPRARLRAASHSGRRGRLHDLAKRSVARHPASGTGDFALHPGQKTKLSSRMRWWQGTAGSLAFIAISQVRRLLLEMFVFQAIEGGPVDLGNKPDSKALQDAGKAKEKAGEATNNDQLKEQGLQDQAEAKAKQPGEHAEDEATIPSDQ